MTFAAVIFTRNICIKIPREIYRAFNLNSSQHIFWKLTMIKAYLIASHRYLPFIYIEENLCYLFTSIVSRAFARALLYFILLYFYYIFYYYFFILLFYKNKNMNIYLLSICNTCKPSKQLIRESCEYVYLFKITNLVRMNPWEFHLIKNKHNPITKHISR